MVAEKIRFIEDLLESEIRINSTIETIDHDLSLITVLGIPVLYSNATRLDDHSGSAVAIESIEELDSGDFVEIRGFNQPDGQHMVGATRLTKETADEYLLKARLTSVTGNSLNLLGQHISTNGMTEYESISGASISEQEFFSTVHQGALIKAVVEHSTGSLVATELSIEDD